MKKEIKYPILILIVLVGIYFVYTNYRSEKPYLTDKTFFEYKENKPIPSFEFPLKYFRKEDVIARNGSSDQISEWNSATFDSGYRSHPTTDITLPTDYYSNEIKELPGIKINADIYIMENDIGHNSFTEQIDKYGNIARRFLPYETITFVKEFDTNGDGAKETLAGVCELWGNGCPHNIHIIKNNMTVFSTKGLDILDTRTGHGFYLKWSKTHNDPSGYIITRFVYENDKYIPIYEQEVLYFRVENSDL